MDEPRDNITAFPGAGPTEDKPQSGVEAGTFSLPEASGDWRSSHRKLVAVLLCSPHDCGAIARKDATAARSISGIEAVMFSEDLGQFTNTLGRDFRNEPLLAADEVCFKGQPIAIIVGENREVCEQAREAVRITYHEAPGIVTLEHALAMKSYHGTSRKVSRGNAVAALEASEKRLKGTLFLGPQRPCPETIPTVSVSWRSDGKALEVNAPALMPNEVRSAVAEAAGMSESSVTLEAGTLSGPANAMELEPVRLAALATHAARKTKSSVEIHLEPDSPLFRGQRHASRASFEAGYGEDGIINAVDIRLALDAGYFAADSETVLDRALLHCDGCYSIPNFRVRAILCKTNGISSSSMPAEGAAQGSWIIEEIMQRVADDLILPAHDVREVNFYDDRTNILTAPYGQPVSGAAILRTWGHVIRRSDYYQRFQDIQDWNDANRNCKRGIAAVPLRFGLGDTRQNRNRGMVLMQILADGSIQVRPGVVDLQDGLDGQIREEIAFQLGVDEETIRVLPGDFEVIAQATPVLGVDVAGLILRAIDDACSQLRERLGKVAIHLLAARGHNHIDPSSIYFAEGKVVSKAGSTEPLTFVEVIEEAWEKRENLMVAGYHRSADIWWDRESGQGCPFSAFTYAAAVAEVQIDTFTGEVDILKIDVAHEGSPSINQGSRDAAQLARAIAIGSGWVLNESVPPADATPNHQFRVAEAIAGFNGAPCALESDRLRPSSPPESAPGDPCSEAPVLLGYAVRQAVWNALQEFAGTTQIHIDLPLPATPPVVLNALKEISLQQQQQVQSAQQSSPGDRRIVG